MMPRLRENLLSSLAALTVAAPMSYVVQLSLGMQYSGWTILLLAAASLIVLDIAAWNRVTAIAVPSAAVLLCLALWPAVGEQGRQAIVDFFVWSVHFIQGGWSYTYDWGLALTAIATFLTTLFVWLFGKKLLCFPALFTFVVASVLFKWLSGLDDVLVPGMLACGGLIPLWAKSFQRRTAKKANRTLPENGMALYLLPVSALIVLIGLTSATDLQSRNWQSHTVHDLFQRVNNYLADYTNFNRPRNSFSIGTFGLMPMGSRLGGPVKLSDVDVMNVDAPGRMLLRGTVYNNYTGSLWTNTLDSKRYKFTGAADETRKDAFDLGRPTLSGAAKVSFDRYVTPITIHVRPVVNCPSTLFVPSRGIREVTSDQFLAVLPYYNASGEVFSSSDVLAGYSYTIKDDYLNNSATGFSQMMNTVLALGLKDTPQREQYIRDNYLKLPGGIDQSVYDLTNNLLAGESFAAITGTIAGDISTYTLTVWNPPPVHNDYEKALAIQDYLMKNCKYTLTPANPPKGVDFVSYFLKTDSEGYCTYFASAMAVMARIAGIPSRYVEGYLLPNKDARDPYYAVSGKNAHAWAELYFEGVGWIPFDATPVGSGIGENSGNAIGFGHPAPTPPPHPESPSGGIQSPARPWLRWGDVIAWLWTLPAAAAAFAIFWILRRLMKARARVSLRNVQKRYADRRLQCAFYYFELLRLLEYYDRAVMHGETPYAFAARVDRWLKLVSGKFADVAELIARVSYSSYVPTRDDVGFMARFHTELAKYTLKTTGLPFYLWHHILGYGRKGLNRRRRS